MTHSLEGGKARPTFLSPAYRACSGSLLAGHQYSSETTRLPVEPLMETQALPVRNAWSRLLLFLLSADQIFLLSADQNLPGLYVRAVLPI